MELESKDVDFDLVEGLEKLQPFGEGNSEPIFAMKNLVVQEKRILGNGNKHIKLFLAPADGSPKIFEVVAFIGYDKYLEIKEGSRIEILCNVQKDEWNGNRKIQLMLIDAKII